MQPLLTRHASRITLALALLLLVCSGAAATEQAFRPGKDGWLTLFDGSEKGRWQPSKGSDWKLAGGVAAGTKGELVNYWHWVDFELVALVRGAGELRCRLSQIVMAEQAGYWLDLADGTLRAAKGRVVAKGAGSATDAWRRVRLVASKGTFTVSFDGTQVAQGSDHACPRMGKLALAARGKPLELKLLRVRPLNREKLLNVPSPNSACFVCHANFEDETIAKTHAAEDVACAACHGTSLAHRSDEDNVTAPDVMFLRGEVDPACLQCHKRHKPEKKRKDGKGPPPKHPTCTDCHGSHRARN